MSDVSNEYFAPLKLIVRQFYIKLMLMCWNFIEGATFDSVIKFRAIGAAVL